MTSDPPSAATLVTWDDFEPGTTYRLETFTIDRRARDAFHASFGASAGVASSPVFLTARLMRAVTDGYLARAAGLGAGGVSYVDWPTPAPVGQPLNADMICESKRALASRPGVGLTVLRYEVRTASGDCIIRWRANQFVAMADSTTNTLPAPTAPQMAVAGPMTLPVAAEALGSHTFSRAEILAFARDYDPQPFHLDDTAAANSLFGALCASGWHTTAVWFRMLCDLDARRIDFARFPEPDGVTVSATRLPVGFRDVVWRRPVYVGDTITFAELLPDTADANQPEPDGAARFFAGYNQAGTLVFEMTAIYDLESD